MSAKHTPGPWSVVRVHGELLGVGAAEHPHPGVTVNRMVCNTIFDGDDVPASQREADAHLLAASLKMRDALQAMLTDSYINHDPAVLRQAEAALRAARGEVTSDGE